MNVRATHNVMQKHYEYIEKMGLVDEYEKVVFPAEVIENTNPQTEDEKVEFMISMLSVDYWDNDSAYEATGEVDTFYKLVEECKSNNELARKVSRKLYRLFINENLPGKPSLNSSKIDLLSDLHTSLDFGIEKTELCSHLFIEMYEFYERSSPLVLACWEKLIDRPEAYCGFKKIQGALKEHSPHLFEKFVLLTPPKPESYEEFWESGKIKESGTRVCEREGLATSWYEDGQKEYETSYVNGKKDGLTTLWYENGQKHVEINYVNNKEDGLTTLWHENGQKSAEVNYKDGKQEGLAAWWYEDGQKSEFNYKNDKQEGLTTWWYASGSKSGEANFFYGERNGTRTLWDKDGNVTFLATYNNGESNDQNGLEPQYDDENDLTHYIEYKDGVVVNEKVEK
jgi:antitoxin component YwqK of YwqJK toxin-antitoxin module